jgi:hypothetical protein
MSLNSSDGRPPQDAQFQNFKANSSMTSRRLTTDVISSNAVVAGEIVADQLTVNTLQVNDTSNITPFPGYVSLPLPAATLTNNAVLGFSTWVGIKLPVPVVDIASWSTYVPAATLPLFVYVPTLALLNTNSLTVTIDGTAFTITDTQLKLNTAYLYKCGPLSWPTSGNLSVSVASAVGANIIIPDDLYIGY